ncbi:MAG: excalibur calcium-binding domain-containing protein [Kineosporiaceae bacterium]|nr:excalibur calcium-binding domain-containing protein [Kineosporiaceae bacterium]
MGATGRRRARSRRTGSALLGDLTRVLPRGLTRSLTRGELAGLAIAGVVMAMTLGAFVLSRQLTGRDPVTVMPTPVEIQAWLPSDAAPESSSPVSSAMPAEGSPGAPAAPGPAPAGAGPGAVAVTTAGSGTGTAVTTTATAAPTTAPPPRDTSGPNPPPDPTGQSTTGSTSGSGSSGGGEPTSPSSSPPGSSAAPSPSPSSSPSSSATTPAAAAPQPAVYYRNCTEVAAAGVEPLVRGEPGYRAGLDQNNDGIACSGRPS